MKTINNEEKFNINLSNIMEKRILVVVDVQPDFIDGILGTKEAQAAVPGIINKIKNNKWDYIITTQDTHEENYLETREGRNLPYPHCIRDTKGWEVAPEVKAALDESPAEVLALEKPTFGSDMLNPTLGSLVGGEEFYVEFVGFCTDICVLSNVCGVKRGFYETANIVVDASCCAGVTPQKHLEALSMFESQQVKVINK